MPASCKTIRYKGRTRRPVIRPNKTAGKCRSDSVSSESEFGQIFYSGEDEFDDPFQSEPEIKETKSRLEMVREWVERQRFIPQDLSDEFLLLFLSTADYVVESTTEKIQKYFYSRQEPSPLFTCRDPLSPENEKIYKKLYVLPMPDTTDDGRKIILTGLVAPTPDYEPMEHAKAFATVIDLLIWEKDFGFGDFVVVLDGRGFKCPQLIASPARDHRSITSLLLDTIPGTLRSLYILYPPAYAKHVADTRDGIWFTIVRSKQEMVQHLSRDILPLEYGGNLGHLGDLLDQWLVHLAQSRNFFINFEKKMTIDYCRRICHEREVAEGGKNWIRRMKLEADEWEYKIRYYEKMKTFKPLKHPAFGPERLLRKSKEKPWKDPMAECRKFVKLEEEREKTFEVTHLYNGYAKEISLAKLQAERENLVSCEPVLELHVHYFR